MDTDSAQPSTEQKVKRPLAVILVAILFGLQGILSVGGSVIFIIAIVISYVGGVSGGIEPAIDVFPSFRGALGFGQPGEILMVIGLILFMLALGVVLLLTSVGLWRLRDWARVTAIIISALTLVYIIIGPLMAVLDGEFVRPNCLSLALNILVMMALGRDHVRAAFYQADKQRAAAIERNAPNEFDA